MFKELLGSLKGNFFTRIRDPFLGTFSLTWIVCNWYQLIILFWGKGLIDERAYIFYSDITENWLNQVNSFFWIPLSITLMYLLIFPWISLLLKYCQNFVNNKLHQQAVKVELSRYTQEEKLNIARVKADPNKPFLEQLAQLAIKKEEDLLKLKQAETEKAKVNAEESRHRADTIQLEDEAKRKKINSEVARSDAEKKSFEAASAIHRASIASNRFPTAYMMMSLLDESLKMDGVILSLTALGETVSSIFGYQNFKDLLNDEDFNNKKLTSVKYIYYDSERVFESLKNIADDEDYASEPFSAEVLFDHVHLIFDDLPYKFVESDSLKQLGLEFCEENRFDFLQRDDVISEMSASDTIYEDVEFYDVEEFKYDEVEGFQVIISAIASGYHRKEEGVSGQDMSLTISLKAPPVLGKFALGGFVITNVKAQLVYGDM